MEYLLALDQGTTSSRAILFDRQGRIISMVAREFEQIYPHPGWVEHNPLEIWETQRAVALEAVAESGLAWDDIAAIGITNQRETVVAWDRQTGTPIHNAIVWQDRRTADLCSRLKAEGLEDWFRSRTGLRLDPYFSGTKMRWIMENVPEARTLAQSGRLAFGTIDSWIVWNLSEGRFHVSDVSNASRTLVMNIHSVAWDDELLEAFSLPRNSMPDICASSGELARTDPAFAPRSIPICGMAGDQQSALFGQMCRRPGMAKNTYGTGCFILENIGPTAVSSESDLLTTVAWRIGDTVDYALEGSVFIAGAAVQWLRDGLGLIDSAPEIEDLARSVTDSGGVYVVPAFTGLGAPHWDPYARGTIIGITRGTTSAHVARAALDSIAFQSTDVMRAMERDAGATDRLSELRVDGGASRNDLLMQTQADLLQVPIVRPRESETTALGAAYLAGLGCGLWSSPDEIDRLWEAERTFEPSISGDEADARLSVWRRAVDRARGWIQEGS